MWCTSFPCTAAALCLLSGLAECPFVGLEALPHASAASVVRHQDTTGDTALLRAVLRATAVEEQQMLRVEPRPLKPDPSISFFVHTYDMADVPQEVIRERAEVLAREGIEQFTMFREGNSFEEPSCTSGPGGLSRIIDPEDTAAIAAEMRNRAQPPLPLCVLVGLPRPGGAWYPPGKIDEHEQGLQDGYQTTRVVTISAGKRSVYDVVAAPSKGGWEIVKVVALDHAWS